jgi:seryl-tRNA synthetase
MLLQKLVILEIIESLTKNIINFLATMLRRFCKHINVFKRNVSALYITGDKAMENYAVLTPYLDYEKRLENIHEIEENLSRRKLKSFKIDDLKLEYEMFKRVENRKKDLELQRTQLAKKMKEDRQNEGLKTQGRILREELKLIKENSYFLEDQFVHNYLKLPNTIHEKTPIEKEVIYSYREHESKEMNDQIDNLIEFYDPTCYYMKGEAAMFDILMPMAVSDYYSDNGYVKFSNPDFVRSIIPESANINPLDVYQLNEDNNENKLNLLHLSGNASFLSFLPYICKLIVFPTQFPLKLVSTGKMYNQENHMDVDQNLYKVVQSTCCQLFVAASDDTTFDSVITEQVQHIKNIFEPLNQHFRIVSYPADELASAEAYRIGVEMFSQQHGSYVEVGNFSYYGDFISKRLLFSYRVRKEHKFPHLYGGSIMNVMNVLVNLIECNKNFKCSV